MYVVFKGAVRIAVSAVVFAFFLRAAPAQTQELREIPDRVQDVVASLPPLARLPDSTRLHLAIGLPLRNREGLTNLLKQIYDPKSPHYHQYLTPEQFTERFGPAERDYDALIHFAESSGLTVRGKLRTRMLLEIEGRVPDIEKALHVVLHTYAHPKESRTFFAPDRAPSVPAEIPVLAISGLDDFVLPQPTDLHATPLMEGVRPLYTGSIRKFLRERLAKCLCPGRVSQRRRLIGRDRCL